MRQKLDLSNYHLTHKCVIAKDGAPLEVKFLTFFWVKHYLEETSLAIQEFGCKSESVQVTIFTVGERLAVRSTCCLYHDDDDDDDG